MSEVSGKAFDGKLLRRILGYTRPYRGIFILAIILTITLSFLSVIRPLLIRHAVNDFVVVPTDSSHADFLKMNLLIFTVVMIVFLILESVMQFINQYTTSLIGQRIVRDLRVQLNKKILTFRSKYFDNTPIGMLVTRVVSDIEAINDVFTQGFIVIAGDLLTIVVYLTAMLIVD